MSRAIEDNDVARVKTLLLYDANLDYLDDPIATASATRNGAMIMLVNQFMLLNAIMDNDEEGMRKAINRGANPFALIRENFSVFHLAKQHDFLDELIDVSYQRAKKTDYLPHVDYTKQQTHGWTALHAAALLGLDAILEGQNSQYNFDAKAKIPAVTLELLLAQQNITPQNSRELSQFYASHPAKDGLIEISINDLRNMKGLESEQKIQSSPVTSQRGLFSTPRKEGSDQISDFKKKM